MEYTQWNQKYYEINRFYASTLNGIWISLKITDFPGISLKLEIC